MDTKQYLYLTTIGHKSGKPHEIEIWYVQHNGCYYLVAEKREHAHWVQNLRATPQITFRVGEIIFNGTATIPTDDKLISIIKALMNDKYNWSDGLVVQLCADADIT